MADDFSSEQPDSSRPNRRDLQHPARSGASQRISDEQLQAAQRVLETHLSKSASGSLTAPN